MSSFNTSRTTNNTQARPASLPSEKERASSQILDQVAKLNVIVQNLLATNDPANVFTATGIVGRAIHLLNSIPPEQVNETSRSLLKNCLGNVTSSIAHFKDEKIIKNLEKIYPILIEALLKGKNLSEAINQAEALLRISIKLYGANSQQVYSTLDEFSVALSESGENQEAITYREKAVAICRKIESKIFLANSLSNLGLLYVEIQDYKKADFAYNEALSILNQEIDPEAKLLVPTVLSNLAVSSRHQKLFNKAAALHVQALELLMHLGLKETPVFAHAMMLFQQTLDTKGLENDPKV